MSPGRDDKGVHHRPSARSIWRLFRRKVRTKRSLRYRVVRALIVSLVLISAGATGLVLARESLIRLLIKPRLEAMLGVEMSATGFRTSMGGRVSLTDVQFSAPGIDGPAGVILSADEITASVQIGRMLRGGGADAIKGMIAVNPVFRVSQNLRDGSLNIDPIILSGAGADSAESLPELQIVGGTVEFAEHEGDWFNVLARIKADGLLEAPDPESPRYVLSLTEITDEERPPMRITGEIDMETRHATVEAVDFDLAAWSPESTPTSVRSVWSRLEMEGIAPSARMDYDPQSGVSAMFELRDVNLSAPTPLALLDLDEQGLAPERMRLHDVDGTMTFHPSGIEAELQAVAQDVPVSVAFSLGGFDLASPFDAVARIDPFFFNQREGLGAFAPPEVRDVLDMLSGPAGIVSGTVRVHRDTVVGSPDEGIEADGTFRIEDGLMTYVDFPYPVRDIEGTISFTLDAIELKDLRGFGPSGAHVYTSGRIAPVADYAGVDLHIEAERLPVDDVLLDALPPEWHDLVQELMDEESYRQMRRNGVVQTRREQAGTASRIAELTRDTVDPDDPTLQEHLADLGRSLRRPVFEVGGEAAIDVRLTRPPGLGQDYTQTVRVEMDRASILPRSMPYPLVVDNLVIDVEKGVVDVVAGGLRGVTGGIGDATIHLDTSRNDFENAVEAQAALRSVPIDGMFRQSLTQFGDGGAAAAQWLEGLGASGQMDMTVDVRPDSDGLRRLEVNSDIRTVELRPDPLSPPVLTDGQGRASLVNDVISMNLSQARFGGGTATLNLHGVLGETPSVDLEVRAEQITAEAPVESLVEPFSTGVADTLRRLRSEYEPFGWGDVDVDVTYADDEAHAQVRATNLLGFEFNSMGGRLAVGRVLGEVTVDTRASLITFDNVFADLWFNEKEGADVTLAGTVGLTGQGPDAMQVQVHRAEVASELAKTVLARYAPAAGDFLQKIEAVGIFGGNAELNRGLDGQWDVSGVIEPMNASIVFEGAPVSSDDAQGRIFFENKDGYVESLRFAGPDWVVTLGGGWGPHVGDRIDLAVDIEALGWTEDMRAFFPQKVRTALDALQVAIDGPWSMEDARLLLEGGGSGVGAFDGTVRLHDGRFRVGLPITDAIGVADIAVAWSGSEGIPEMDLTLYLETFKANNVPIGEGRARILSADGENSVRVTDFSADLASGRVAGIVDVELEGEGEGRYAADLRVAGIDLGQFIQQFGGDPIPPPESDDRGFVSGDISFVGRIKRPDTRIGRGVLVAERGNLMRNRLLISVIELSNLQVPVREELDFGVIEFSLEENLVLIERIVAQSKTIMLAGRGTMLLPGGELDLTFTTRARNRVPVLSHLIEALRNQLVVARVTGTVKEPKIRAQPLPGARRLFAELFSTKDARRTRRVLSVDDVADTTAPVVTLEK